jgi:class 3 adenylate cyclase
LEIHDTKYVTTADDVYLAYQVVGDGSIDVAWQLDVGFGNIDLVWNHPWLGRLFEGVAGFSRLVLHDRRGTGLSSRNVAPPNLETCVADLHAVLNAVGSVQPVLVGGPASGAICVLLAATAPERLQSIVWYCPMARAARAHDYPWGVGPDYFALDQRSLERWGTAEFGEAFQMAEGLDRVVTDDEARFMGMLTRHNATPDVAKELNRIWYETDVRDVLAAVRVPVLLVVHDDPPFEAESNYIADHMPDARLVTVRGPMGSPEVISDLVVAIREFVGVERPPITFDTVLTTVLFTDIVASTERQAAMGDRAWKNLIERHHALVREAIDRWRGVENDTAGDGFYATFDGPARAIRCALEVVERVRALGIDVRAGVHTGECELVDGKAIGIAVTTGARISSMAEPSQVLVTQTVKDLVAGSGLTFEDIGELQLRGIPDRRHLYRVAG